MNQDDLDPNPSQSAKNARRDGLWFLFLAAMTFLLLGSALEYAAPTPAQDFRLVYYSARCLIEGHDPYNAADLLRIFDSEGAEGSPTTEIGRITESQYLYFPTAFSITIPFAFMPFGMSHIVWLALMFGSLCLASYLLWEVCASVAPVLAGAMIGFSLANCPLFMVVGNPGSISIALCAISVWCFIRERFIWSGAACLAMSLMLKPHNAVFVWLYFLCAGGKFRLRALQTLVLIFLLSVPSFLLTMRAAPNWEHELHTNLVANSARGGLSDPGPSSKAAHGIGMLVDLQAIFSMVHDDPEFYNPVSYGICGILLFVWMVRVLSLRASPRVAWFAIAPISAISLLPVYHRLGDAKLLLLVVPACSVLWAEGSRIGKIAVALAVAGFVLTADFTWIIALRLIGRAQFPNIPILNELRVALQIVPVPLCLLMIGIGFLWIFIAYTGREMTTNLSGN